MIAAMVSKVIGLLYKSPLSNIIGSLGMGYTSLAQNAYMILLMIASFSIPQAVSKLISERIALRDYRNAHKFFKGAMIYAMIVGGAVALFCLFGAGLIIPLSTGLISRYFTGEYRVRQFGYSSAITNMTLVVATAVTGYLAEVHWRLPFAVYLLPLISLVLSAYLKKDAASVTIKQAAAIIPPIQSTPVISGKYGIHIRHLVQLMLFYGLVTYVVLAVTFNLPFLMEAHHFSSGNSGLMISLFFLAIMAPGFMLDSLVKLLGNKTKLYSLLAIAIGLLLIWISPTEWLIVPGCILVGLGYGIIQPLIYDKTVDTAIPQKTTLALAFVMVMNYLAILLSPFITDFFQWIFHTGSQEFPFIFNLCITILIMYWAYAKKEEFLFSD